MARKLFKNRNIAVVLVFAGVIGVFVFMISFLEGLSDKNPCVPEAVNAAFAHDESVAIVRFTDEGVFPECSNIPSGGTVIWVNEGANIIQVSSDPHPVHSDNPEISDGKFVLILPPGESAQVTLEKRGTFGFHDHINPSLSGKIIIN